MQYKESFKKAATFFGALVALSLLIIFLGVGHVLTILSLNALFNLSIAISFWNWLAVFWLSMVGVAVTRAGVSLGINQYLSSLINKV